MSAPGPSDRISIGRNDADGSEYAHFMCPGCQRVHGVNVKGDPTKMPVWGFNGSRERPTFTPSIKAWGKVMPTEGEYERIIKGEKIALADFLCHSFVTDGRIQFLDDCTHALKGQTVEIPLASTWHS